MQQSLDIARLLDIGVLEKAYYSAYIFPIFAILKNKGTIRVVTNFRKLKLLLKRQGT
jgi:hypothetical protein